MRKMINRINLFMEFFKRWLLFPRVSICIIILTISGFPLFSQNTIQLSGGVTGKWVNESLLPDEGSEGDVISIAKPGYFISASISWLDDMDTDFSAFLRFSIEKSDNQVQNWERKPIGEINSTILRIDPFYLRYRINHSKFLYIFNPFSFSLSTGKSELMPGSYCYDQGLKYLIRKMHFDKSRGWSLIGLGIEFEFSKHLAIGFETVMLEGDAVNLTFLTDIGDIKAEAITPTSFFPGKIRVIIQI